MYKQKNNNEKKAYSHSITLLVFTLFLICCSEEDHQHRYSETTTFISDTTSINNLNPKNDTTIILDSTSISNLNPKNDSSIIRTTSIFMDSIIVAHWNIGHFSNGKSDDTTISNDSIGSKQNSYRKFIEDAQADIFGVCEYSPNFDQDGNSARDAIFYTYDYASIGEKVRYNCNSIFTRGIPFIDEHQFVFDERAQYRYYSTVNLMINNDTIRFVETHLDWNEGSNGSKYRLSQMQKLIDTFKCYTHVIICADFNIANNSEYDIFKEAGFCLANCGDNGIFYTYPASNPDSALDNIIVKGFNIKNVSTLRDPNLSDHCLIKCVLTIQE